MVYSDAGYLCDEDDWEYDCDKEDEEQVIWMHDRGVGHNYISGTWALPPMPEYEETMYLDVGIIYHKMSDFCGGFLAHSPSVLVRTKEVLGSTLYQRSDKSFEGMMELPNANGLTKLTQWEDYGYEILARHITSVMSRNNTPSTMMAGKVKADAPTQRFYKAFAETKQSSHYWAVNHTTLGPGVESIPMMPAAGPVHRTGRVVENSIIHSKAYKNPNSGNMVQWTNLISAVGAKPDTVMAPEERTHMKQASRWVRRVSWRNG
jgi:hypothetical protein